MPVNQKSLRDNSSKVAILGCGYSGMITALSLASKGINTTIFESRDIKAKSFYGDIRSTALNDASKKYLAKIGFWSKIKDLVCPIVDIYVADNKAPEMLHFASKSLGSNQFMGYLIENDPFKKALLAAVIDNNKINIIDNFKYKKITNNNGVCEITCTNNSKHKFDLIITCDGRNSLAKSLFFSNSVEKDYGQTALTFIVHHKKPHQGTAVEHFMPDGPFAILPLVSGYDSSVVWTVPSKKATMLCKLDEEEFNFIIQENFGSFLGDVKVTSKIAGFPLKSYVTKNYYNRNIALIADTAHIIHPLAGQGLNQGIKDIESLVSNLKNYGINNQALIKYEQERQQDNINMFEITNGLNMVFSNNSKLLHNSRQIAFKTIEKVPLFKRKLIKYAMGLR
ncbi:MAG: FAD-dependent monooxygenase [Rickettsiaceae bacterium]|nr:FAD-dependent monooxygenase [Rickettsiaceae bacterium]